MDYHVWTRYELGVDLNELLGINYTLMDPGLSIPSTRSILMSRTWGPCGRPRRRAPSGCTSTATSMPGTGWGEEAWVRWGT